MTNKNHAHKKGFTLIELLLYIATSSVLLITVIVFFSGMLESRVKNQTISEVEQQGIAIMQTIARTTRNAEAITSPSSGNTSSSLTLDVISGSLDPTLFSLSGGDIMMKEGSGSEVALTNNRVTASSLQFQNLSRSGTPGIIRISFVLSHVNPSGKYEFDFSKTFQSSVSLRHP